MNEQVFRRWVLVILMALALLGIGKAVLTLMAGA